MRFWYRRQHCLQTFFLLFDEWNNERTFCYKNPCVSGWQLSTGDISVSIEWQVRGVRYSLFSIASFPFLHQYNCTFFFYNRRQDEDFKATDQCPDFLSPEQHQLLSGKPSMKGFTERLSTMKQETVTQVWQTYIVRRDFRGSVLTPK